MTVTDLLPPGTPPDARRRPGMVPQSPADLDGFGRGTGLALKRHERTGGSR